MASSIARARNGILEIHFDRNDREVFSELPSESTATDWEAILGTALRYGGSECAQSVIDAMATLIVDKRQEIQWIRKGERVMGEAASRTDTEDDLDRLLSQYAALRDAVRSIDVRLRADLERIDGAALKVALDDVRLARSQIRATFGEYFDVDGSTVDALPERTFWLGKRPRMRPEHADRLDKAMTEIDSAYARWLGHASGHGSSKTMVANRRSLIWVYSKYRTLVRKAAALDPVAHRVVPVPKAPPRIDDRVFDALELAWSNSFRLGEHVQRRGDAMEEVRAKLDRYFSSEAKRKGPPHLVAIEAYRGTLEGIADELDLSPYSDPSVVHHDGTGVWAYPALLQRTMNLMGVDERSPIRSAAGEVAAGPEASLLKSLTELLVIGGVGMLASGAGAPVGIAIEVIGNGILAARDLMEVLERQAREGAGAGFSMDPEDAYQPRLQPVSDAFLGASLVGTTFPYSHLIPGKFGTILGIVAPLAASLLSVPTPNTPDPGDAP